MAQAFLNEKLQLAKHQQAKDEKTVLTVMDTFKQKKNKRSNIIGDGPSAKEGALLKVWRSKSRQKNIGKKG